MENHILNVRGKLVKHQEMSSVFLFYSLSFVFWEEGGGGGAFTLLPQLAAKPCKYSLTYVKLPELFQLKNCLPISTQSCASGELLGGGI